MAEDPPLRVEEGSVSDESEESGERELDHYLFRIRCKESGRSCNSTTSPTCSKLLLPEHIAAYCEKRELIRDGTQILSCDDTIGEKVMSNYIIAKEILSNLCWQDKMLCKLVSTTWRSAVNTLIREQFHLVDFVYTQYYNIPPKPGDHDKLVKSDDFHIAPMAVLVFVNNAGSTTTAPCKHILPCPCKTPCKEKTHSSKSYLPYLSI